jgi:hypothetical protein
LTLSRLWQTLPAANRQRLLQTLGRLVAQQLPTPPPPKEVADEQP